MPRAADLLNYRTPQLAAGQVDRSIPMATPSGKLIPTPPTESQLKWEGALSNPSIANILYGAGETAYGLVTAPIPYAAGMVGSAYGALTGQDPRATGAKFEQATTFQPQSPTGQYYSEQVGEKLSTLPPVVSGIPLARLGAGSAKYAGEQYAAPLAEKALTMYEQGKLTPGMSPTSEIFIGKSAKDWDAAANARAVEMEKAGATPREIWSETMNWKGPEGLWRQEIDDSKAVFDPQKLRATETVKTHEAFTHDPLYKNYPAVQYYELGWEQTPGVRGSHSAKTQTFTTAGGGTLFNPEEAKSTLLHEIQHGIQSREDFARGGNPANMSTILDAMQKVDLKPLREGAENWKFAANNLARADNNLYMHKLDKLMYGTNVKPRQITKLSDFYEFSDKIRSEFGIMPKKPGAARDAWISNAAQYIKERNIEKKPYLANYDLKNPKDLQNQIRRDSRVMDKYRPDAIKAAETLTKYKNIKALTPEEQYMRSAGEAESRATQARINLSMDERRAKFPEESYDRKMEDLITYNNQKLFGALGDYSVDQPTDFMSILYK
jgi:hypothetical protein